MYEVLNLHKLNR